MTGDCQTYPWPVNPENWWYYRPPVFEPYPCQPFLGWPMFPTIVMLSGAIATAFPEEPIMSDPTPTPTPTPTIGQRLSDAVHGVTDWAKTQETNLAHAITSAGFSKPVADLVATVEDTFSKTLPTVIAAGEKSLADSLTPEHIQALVTLVGEIGAAAVQQLLARIPVAVATTAAAATTV